MYLCCVLFLVALAMPSSCFYWAESVFLLCFISYFSENCQIHVFVSSCFCCSVYCQVHDSFCHVLVVHSNSKYMYLTTVFGYWKVNILLCFMFLLYPALFVLAIAKYVLLLCYMFGSFSCCKVHIFVVSYFHCSGYFQVHVLVVVAIANVIFL